MKLILQGSLLLLMAMPASSGFYRTYPDTESGSVDWDEFRDAFEIPGVGYAAGRWELDLIPPGHEGLAILDYDGNLSGLQLDGVFGWEYSCGQLVHAWFEDGVLEARWYDPDGTLLDAHVYMLPYGDGWQISDNTSGIDGTLMLCANYLYYNALAIRIAPDRSLDWTRMFPSEIGGYPYTEFRTVGISEEGLLHFGLDGGLGLNCLNRDGDLLWSYSSPFDGDVFQIAEVDYGCVMACGEHLVAVDPEGDELWALESPVERSYFSGVASADEGCVVAYVCQIDGGAACLMKLDAAGQEIWSREYPPSGFCSIHRCADGGYLLAGASGCEPGSGPEDIDPLLIKSDANGWFGVEGLDPAEPGGTLTVTLPANPAIPMSTISIDLSCSAGASLSIYDMAGRRMAGTDWQPGTSGTLEYCIPDLGIGLYFCRVSSGPDIVTVEFVLLD